MTSRFVFLLERLGRLLQSDAHSGGLKPVQWDILRYLKRANRFSQNQSSLIAFLGSTKGTVSQSLSTLEEKGLVERRAADHDKRAINLALTGAGEAALSQDPLLQISESLDRLGESRISELEGALESALLTVLASRGNRPFGVCRHCRHYAESHPEGRPHFCRLLSEALTTADAAAICAEQEPAKAA